MATLHVGNGLEWSLLLTYWLQRTAILHAANFEIGLGGCGHRNRTSCWPSWKVSCPDEVSRFGRALNDAA